MLSNVTLIGMPGCGKTTVGAMLAAELGLPFVDIDTKIEEMENKSISEIFTFFGEAYFRECESVAIQSACQTRGSVIATGGGAVLRAENMARAKACGVIVYLERSLDSIVSTLQVDGRPLLAGGAERLSVLYAERKILYETYASITIQNEGTAQAAVNSIKEAIS